MVKYIPMIYLSTLEERGGTEGGRKEDRRTERTYPNDESDCCTSRSCHDFCTIGDKIKKRRYNGFSAMVKLVSQNC